MRKSMVFFLALIFCFVLAGVSPEVRAAGAKDAKKETSGKKESAPKEAAKKETASKEGKQEQAKSQQAGGEKVAVVNGTIITKAEFDRETGRFERQLAMSGQAMDEAQTAELKKKVLDGMIGREVLKQETAKLGIKADEAEIGEQLAGLKKRFPSEADFTNALVNMNLTEDSLKAQLTQDMAIKKMIDQQVAGKVKVTPEEAKAFYDGNPEIFKMPESVRASHILIKVDSKASPEDKAKAKEKIAGIQKRIQNGEDFAAVAKEVSECPSKDKGGDLDFFQKGQMVGPFEDAAFAMKPGQVSDIVETPFGFHLIKVTEKKDPSVMGFDEIKDKIEQHLKQDKTNQQLAAYVEQLKSKAKIETFTK